MVKGRELVLAEFGEWPCFHDAEVLSLELERGIPAVSAKTEVRMRVHVRLISHGTKERLITASH